MDATLINYIVLIAVAIVMALAYGIVGFFANKVTTGESFSASKFLATVVYSIIVGVIAVQSGLISLDTVGNWQTIFSPMWTQYVLIYTGLLYFFQTFVVKAVAQFTSKTTIYKTKAAFATVREALATAIRKMDAESRNFLVFDLSSDNMKAAVLKAVDAAEAANGGAGTYQYAIDASTWVYLIEGGELTGAVHYYFRGWFGTSIVDWKPISDACLTAIRKTGKFPGYDKLY
jgi:hypothetical protein